MKPSPAPGEICFKLPKPLDFDEVRARVVRYFRTLRFSEEETAMILNNLGFPEGSHKHKRPTPRRGDSTGEERQALLKKPAVVGVSRTTRPTGTTAKQSEEVTAQLRSRRRSSWF